MAKHASECANPFSNLASLIVYFKVYSIMFSIILKVSWSSLNRILTYLKAVWLFQSNTNLIYCCASGMLIMYTYPDPGFYFRRLSYVKLSLGKLHWYGQLF